MIPKLQKATLSGRSVQTFTDPDKSVVRLFINAGTNTLFQCHVVSQNFCELSDKIHKIVLFFQTFLRLFILFFCGDCSQWDTTFLHDPSAAGCLRLTWKSTTPIHVRQSGTTGCDCHSRVDSVPMECGSSGNLSLLLKIQGRRGG